MKIPGVLALSLAAAACGSEGWADGSGRPINKPSYALCDGTDSIRLALVTAGGGEAPDSWRFTKALGDRFLYVDGRCNFVASTEVDGAVSTGQFSATQGATLAESLGVSDTAGLVYRVAGGCPDAATSVFSTPDAHLEGACGDEDPPPVVATALAWEPAFELAKSLGTPSSGAVSILATYDQHGSTTDASAWPFSFPVDAALDAKTLTGDEAMAARTLWRSRADLIRARGYLPVTNAGKLYQLHFRDELDAAFAGAIARYEASRHEVARCDPRRVRNAALQDPHVYGKTLRVAIEENAACDLELCWDETFDEKSPVLVHLALQEPARARTCMGAPVSSVSASLQPIIDAFRRGYPKQAVEIDLGFGTLYDEQGDRALCHDRGVESCAQDARCRVIHGALVDGARQCTTDAALGCDAKTMVCNDAITGGQAPDGRRALFSDGCLPRGWSPFYGESPDYGLTARCDDSMCTHSERCPAGSYCTTEDGECRSPCADPSQVCPAVCVGSCRVR